MKERNSQKQSDSMCSRVRTSILLLLLALVAVTATTVAWFSIADKKRYVSEMDQSAVCSDWKSYINKCSEYVGQGNKKSRDRDKTDI